ncbi:hypothetical protein ECZU51_46570 [Escherichia coli]|nr:hypothetical protein ECZU51_46570 [Escherichia coli]
MQRQLTDLLQEGAWHGILLCVLVVLFLFFRACGGDAGIVNAPVSVVTAVTALRLNVC